MTASKVRPRRLPLALTLIFALVAAMLVAPAASAEDKLRVDWTGNGSDSLRVCAEDEDPYLHWSLTPGGNFTSSEEELFIEAGDTPET